MSQNVPVLVLREDTERTRGRDAQRNNIMAAIVIAEAVKSALGPKGMDKMLVDSFGDVTVSNDGISTQVLVPRESGLTHRVRLGRL